MSLSSSPCSLAPSQILNNLKEICNTTWGLEVCPEKERLSGKIIFLTYICLIGRHNTNILKDKWQINDYHQLSLNLWSVHWK